ncbi:hypothetical protein AVEN_122399-1 [Araneus ventricosus]|uniref:Uncharacterized protein n=1 Tax=Araneus ventricosus TaxID=182803 RepID=A0A4Y2TMS1_ARAVE|nr:hypothetical protein AVEN_122399-1 [Araneus ventricosus]
MSSRRKFRGKCAQRNENNSDSRELFDLEDCADLLQSDEISTTDLHIPHAFLNEDLAGEPEDCSKRPNGAPSKAQHLQHAFTHFTHLRPHHR